MRVLVAGAGGMLGQALVPELRRQGMEVVGLTRRELDVTDRDQIQRALQQHRPAAVVQCAAYTAVDAAEAEPDTAFLLNCTAARLLADECQRAGTLLVYPSTDYVFAGDSPEPYRPDDLIGPLNVYGASKAAGEREVRRFERHLIVRTSWLYGFGGRNFVDRILSAAAEKSRIEVVADQVGLPTWTGSLSLVIGRLLKAGARGTFHAADAGEPLSWYEFAKEILELRGLEVRVHPVSTDAYGAAAPRPRFSILDCTATEQMLGESLPDRNGSVVVYLEST